MSHARYKKIMELMDITKTTPPPPYAHLATFFHFFYNIIVYSCCIELSKMVILIGNWLQVLNAKSWEDENCSRSVTRTGCKRTGTTSPASLWCEIHSLEIVFLFLLFATFILSAISQVGWDFQTFWWWSQVGPGEWEKSNSLSPLPPGCNFPQVDAFVYENCSHNVDTFSEFCTG